MVEFVLLLLLTLECVSAASGSLHQTGFQLSASGHLRTLTIFLRDRLKSAFGEASLRFEESRSQFTHLNCN